MPANRQTVPRAEREAEILAAARDVFVADGFDQATMAGIAHEAGMTSANVHYYFSTKEALVAAVARLAYDQLFAGLAEVDDPVERLQRYVAFHLDQHAYRGPLLALAARSGDVASLLAERESWLAGTVALVTDDEMAAAALTATVTGLVETVRPHPEAARVLAHAVTRLAPT